MRLIANVRLHVIIIAFSDLVIRESEEIDPISIHRYYVINISSFLCLPLIQGDSPFGKLEAYIKLEQLGEGSYATVFKGYSK